MRLLRSAVLALSVLAGGCASLPPSLNTAGLVAREVSCAVCEATTDAPLGERAGALADGLRRVSEELGRAAEGSPDAAAILAELARLQDEQRDLFERLLRAALTAARSP